MQKINVVNEEELSNILINMENIETFDLGCAFINTGNHPELGRIIGISGDTGKSAYIIVD